MYIYPIDLKMAKHCLQIMFYAFILLSSFQRRSHAPSQLGVVAKRKSDEFGNTEQRKDQGCNKVYLM